MQNHKHTLNPAIKWSGSKRTQAAAIVSHFPHEIDTYYEPFCGGCSVLYRLLWTPIVKVKHYSVSDCNPDLIALWNAIKTSPESLCNKYAEMWRDFNSCCHQGASALLEHRKGFFFNVRSRLNKTHDPADFLFVMRTTTNGMPRYNDKGEFNNSCHFTRAGINPHHLRSILCEWSRALSASDVEFTCRPYQYLNPKPDDVVYLDPPYAGTRGMYYGGIDLDKFFSWLRSLKCRWFLSFDGRSDKKDFSFAVPKDLYKSHEYLASGNSSFRRIIGNDRHTYIEESLYSNLSLVAAPAIDSLPLIFEGDL